MSLWWLSFVDPARPAGSRFLGGCIVPGDSIAHACREAHLRKCNPGGEVRAQAVPLALEDRIGMKWIGRLLDRKESEELGRELEALSVS